MDTNDRLRRLLDERGWTEYRLAKQCGLSLSTIANIYRRNTVPSVATLEVICKGFGITLSQFFAEGEMVVNFEDRATPARTFSHTLTAKQPHRHGGQPHL